MAQVRIGLLGYGSVGQAIYEWIYRTNKIDNQKYKNEKNESVICDYQVVAVAVKNKDKVRGGVAIERLTDDAVGVARNPNIDVVIEAMGDNEVAHKAICVALENGKTVITSNTALLSRNISVYKDLARRYEGRIFYESAIAGALPLLSCLHQGMQANSISNVSVILNQTAQTVIANLQVTNTDFDEGSKLIAEQLTPEKFSSAVDGYDTALKLCLLAQALYGVTVHPSQVFCRGLRYLKSVDMQAIKDFGYGLKLMGHITQTRRAEDSEVLLRVHPTLIPCDHPLAHVMEDQSAVSYQGDLCGEGLLLGQGEGAKAVASSLAGALKSYAQENSVQKTTFKTTFDNTLNNNLGDIATLRTEYYIRFHVEDRAHVLGRIATLLGQQNINIRKITQAPSRLSDHSYVLMLTHDVLEKDMRLALKEIDREPFVHETTKLIRIHKK